MACKVAGCAQAYGFMERRVHHSQSFRQDVPSALTCPHFPGTSSPYAFTSILFKQNPLQTATAAKFSLSAPKLHLVAVTKQLSRRSMKVKVATKPQPGTPLVEVEDDELNLSFELAKSEEKLRAAANLRARSFYTYPEGRSRDAIQMHQKMKAEDEWATLTRKVGGLEEGYKRTTCLIATCASSEVMDIGTDFLNTCCVIGPQGGNVVTVGTLDLNLGLVLPGELMGDWPKGLEAEHRRAYLSNVCVAQEVRRRGVGLALVEHAKTTVKCWGISDLYVHVVVENLSARKLYEKAGFVYEKEESVKEARSSGRPRRYLLRTQLS